MHGELLGFLDPEFQRLLVELRIEPMCYFLRWVRLLFVREFELSSLLDVWDVLFQQGLESFVPYVALSMYCCLKEKQVLGRDNLLGLLTGWIMSDKSCADCMVSVIRRYSICRMCCFVTRREKYGDVLFVKLWRERRKNKRRRSKKSKKF